MKFIKRLFGQHHDPPAPSTPTPPAPAPAPGDSPESERFRAEGQRLGRDALLLEKEGRGEPVAYWHGLEPGELCISFKHDGTWLNVYLDEVEEGGRVKRDDGPIQSDTPLFGRPHASLPPVDGIFAKGSDAIGLFLDQHGWARDDPYNENFPHPAPGQYERAWQGNCPLYLGGIDAMVGGWNMPWPDDDWHDLLDHELILWTLRDAEPWVEVFKKDGTYVVKQRVS